MLPSFMCHGWHTSHVTYAHISTRVFDGSEFSSQCSYWGFTMYRSFRPDLGLTLHFQKIVIEAMTFGLPCVIDCCEQKNAACEEPLL